MLNNGSILTGKKYVVQIYKIKLHTKNHVDWIKNEVLNFFPFFFKCFNNILVIKKEKKLKFIFFFNFLAQKSYEAFFDHFLPEPCGRKKYFLTKK